jgi:hypothetical protein
MSALKVKPDDAVTESLAQLGASLAARPYARRGVPMSNETIRVLLADDRAMGREGLRLLLRTAPPVLTSSRTGSSGMTGPWTEIPTCWKPASPESSWPET